MKTQFDELKNNPKHHFESDINGEKRVIKVFLGNDLIAKKVQLKKSIRYFGISGVEQLLINDDKEDSKHDS